MLTHSMRTTVRRVSTFPPGWLEHRHTQQRTVICQFSTFSPSNNCSAERDDDMKNGQSRHLTFHFVTSNANHTNILQMNVKCYGLINRGIVSCEQKTFFSTATSPPSNNDDSPMKTSPKHGQKARKLAKKGADKARKGGSKVRELLSKYGWYFGGTYFCIYLVSLSSFYTAIDSGFIDPNAVTNFWGGDLMGDGEDEVDAVKMVANMLEKWEWTRAYSESVEKNPKLTTLGVAWLGTKIIEPARIGVAVFVTPRLARAFGSKSESDQEENEVEVEEETEGNKKNS